MLSLCCLLLAVTSAFAAPGIQIVGGSPAQNCEFPSIVHLKIYNQPTDYMMALCGGTLIGSRHVLTAAHCVDGNVRKIQINIGSSNKLNTGSQSRTASRIVKHSGYVNTIYLIKNDIAILTLDKPVSEDICVKFAPMARKGETFGTSRCIAAGWGDLQFKGISPNELYKVVLPSVPHNMCKNKSMMKIADGILCAGDFRQGGGSTCQGDSGGPLYCPSSNGQMVLAGVTSFGRKCNTEISAFSDVGYFRDWIATNM